ncbi:metallophosphoesterase [Nocardioides jiangxiensis]|uniref:Metallophosphoesterase n=1 Tax=Nocardioides jiangxiensis TaxID=3064524 RepID=A0ABT9B122_9ACTN|nr:metallophosphoesterase [Nocardioides sp. WY-20]MDO7868435.1 metallophosphoesterase [Nocardioides sp. WY-20]
MSPSGLQLAGGVLAAGAAAGAALATYAACEARAYTVRRVTVPVLPAGHAPLRVLHVSDMHLTPGQTRKRDFVRSLVHLAPDLVVNTGDNLAHMRAVPFALDAFAPLMERPGVFVLGSNDYFDPGVRNPFRYLLPDDGVRHTDGAQLPWGELVSGFVDAGWLDLSNRAGRLRVNGEEIAFAGLDDPHISRDDLAAVGPAPRDADLRLGVVHAPYLRALDRFTEQGYDAIIAGHTHGGQVCLPFYGALTTNCDLEPARVKGLHRHPADSLPGDPGSAWLHVSAGLGTNPFVRFRVACRPETTLMTLVER